MREVVSLKICFPTKETEGFVLVSYDSVYVLDPAILSKRKVDILYMYVLFADDCIFSV